MAPEPGFLAANQPTHFSKCYSNVPPDEPLTDFVPVNFDDNNNSNTASLKPPIATLQPTPILRNTEQQLQPQMVASTARDSTDLFQQLLDEYRNQPDTPPLQLESATAEVPMQESWGPIEQYPPQKGTSMVEVPQPQQINTVMTDFEQALELY